MKKVFTLLLFTCCIQLHSQLYFKTPEVIYSHPGPTGAFVNDLMVPMDYNDDGIMDLIGSSQDDDDQFVLQGIENGFEYISIYDGFSQSILEVIDLDGDGDQDVVAEGYLNINNAGIFEQITLQDNSEEVIVAVMDIDNDGDYDFITHEEKIFEDAILRVYENDNFENLSGLIFENQEKQYSKFMSGDIDDDGDEDLVGVFNYGGDPGIRIWYNDGNGDLQMKEDISMHLIDFFGDEIPIDFDGGIGELADMDADGDLDLVLSEGFESIIIAFNDNGFDNDAVSIQNTGFVSALKLVDFNNNGYNDIVYLEHDQDKLVLKVIRNTNDDSFFSRKTIKEFDGSNVIGSIHDNYMNNFIGSYDYNNDGKMDIIVNAIFENSVYLVENLSEVSSIAQVDYGNLEMFPNPTPSTLTINTEDKVQSIQIFDIYGRLVRDEFLKDKQVNVEGLDNGQYQVKLINKNGDISTGKFVKM